MTPEQYLQHLNAQAEQRSREQAERLLRSRGMATPQSASSPAPRANTSEADAGGDNAPSTMQDRLIRDAGRSTTGRSRTAQPTDVSASSGGVGKWVWRLLWAAVAGGLGLLNPWLGQLLAGNWLVFLVLLVFGEELMDGVSHLDVFAEAGYTPDEVVWWITMALAGWAVLRILMRGLSSGDESPARADASR